MSDDDKKVEATDKDAAETPATEEKKTEESK